MNVGGVLINEELNSVTRQCSFLSISKNKELPVPVPWRHITRVEILLHSFVTSALNRPEWSASHPGSFTHGKEPWFPLNMKLGGLNSWSDCFGEERISCVCWDLNPGLSSQ
jgi:hypothetical protein